VINETWTFPETGGPLKELEFMLLRARLLI